jgi:hypothetical protein
MRPGREGRRMRCTGGASLAPRSPGSTVRVRWPSGGATVLASPTPGASTEEVG